MTALLVGFGAGFMVSMQLGPLSLFLIRSTFVIDENGTVERAMYGVKATGHVDKLRRELGV